MEELIDVLDKDGNKTGIVKPKSKVKKDGDYHRAISILIMNSDGEVLFQRRSNKKKVYPNLWSMFLKGHVKSGESQDKAAIREINEELGIKVYEEELKYLYTIKEEMKSNDYIENIFFDTYLLVKDISLDDIKLNDEVSGVQFLTFDEIKYLLESDSKMIVPNKQDYEKVFEVLEDINVKVKKYNGG